MVFRPLWALIVYLVLCSADSDSESDESGERKHRKHKHHSEYLPNYRPHTNGPPMYPTLPGPGGYSHHTYNHPAYHVQPTYGWYAPPPLTYNYPAYGGQHPPGYYGPPQGYGQSPQPYYGQQPYYGHGPPPTGAYSPNIQPPYTASGGLYPNSIHQQSNHGLPNQQPSSPVGHRSVPGGFSPPSPPSPSSSSSSSSSSSTINLQPSPNVQPTTPQPPPGQLIGYLLNPIEQQRSGDHVYLGYQPDTVPSTNFVTRTIDVRTS